MTDYDWNIEIENVRDFDLRQIFDCGQCFRWAEDDGAPTGGEDRAVWKGIAGRRAAVMSYDRTCGLLRICDSSPEGPSEDFWRTYLDLDRDYGRIKAGLASDPSMAAAIETGQGIRILKQEPWETVISFIISQNNNIPRIRKCINSLAEQLGRPVIPGVYALPEPEDLAGASLEDLAPCRLGYRARYLIEAGRQIADNRELCDRAELDPDRPFLDQLAEEGIDSDRAVEALRGICGVGPKVASCIALFGLGKLDSFPIDVWMKRVMNRIYGIPESRVGEMKAFADERFRPYGGIAQQYLFNYIARQQGQD